jgi:hypothetical protein
MIAGAEDQHPEMHLPHGRVHGFISLPRQEVYHVHVGSKSGATVRRVIRASQTGAVAAALTIIDASGAASGRSSRHPRDAYWGQRTANDRLGG